MVKLTNRIRHRASLILAVSALLCLIIYLGHASAYGPPANPQTPPQQSAGQAPVPNVVCSVTLNPTSQSFASNGGMGSFAVTIGPTCPWTAMTNDSWIMINSGAGVGNGTVNYTVASNPTSNARSGSITVGDKTFAVLQGALFSDVDANSPFFTFIGKLSARGVTQGCGVDQQGNRLYCPTATVTREQMAAFIIRALGDLNPPLPQSQRFNDVPPSSPFYAFIDEMAVRQITLGCSTNPPLYCPTDNVTREAMAAFLIRALHAPGYVPPQPQSQRFNDVPPSNPFYAYIDEMAVLQITLGCSTNPPLYCPTDNVTRDQMAAFLVRAFNL